MYILKKIHKWVGLLIGIQVLVWLLSGLVISLLDPAKVSGSQWMRANAAEQPILGQAALLEPAALPGAKLKDVLGVDLTTRRGRPVYSIMHAGGETLFDAVDGSIITTRKAEATDIARRDFSGEGDIVAVERGMAPDMETRDSSGAYWRVDFSDTANTSIYISEASGKILERRNSFWRVQDFFWMLHIMDYPGREDINNSLVISVALVAIWLGLSGFGLLFGSFRRQDFSFLNFLGKPAEAVVTLYDPTTGRTKQVKLRKGSNLFLSLATHDVNLPSICGGGGECGKCRVKYEATDLPTTNDAELGLVPRRLREQGYRLACQQQVERDVLLHVPAEVLSSGL
ncbi:MAG: 2Fe-2S iron-sulfur cluster-binding protein [Lysobacterales bacterium]